MQKYIEISADTPMLDSLRQLLDNDKTALSCQAGTAFPTENLLPGMLCFREDEDKLYQLKADGITWGSVADFTPVNEALALKADTKATTEALALKADKSSTTEALALKADAKATTDSLALKADKSAVNGSLNLKADSTTVNEALALKADSTTVNGALALKANLASPTLTGTPKAPTAAAGTNTTQIATTGFVKTAVDAAVSNMLGDAPAAALDTLKELGDALGNDANFAATMTTALAGKLGSGENAVSATKLATARTINGVAFDGTKNITVADATKLPLSGGTLTGTLTISHADGNYVVGNNGGMLRFAAGSYTVANLALDLMPDKSAKFYGNVEAPSFAGALTGNATSATKLATARALTIGGVSKNFNGSAAVSWTLEEIGAQATLPTGTNGQVLKHNGTNWVAGTDNNTSYSSMSAAEATTGTATSGRVITAAVLKGAIETHAPTPTTITGNAGSATKLATARTINGVSFNGAANIDIQWQASQISSNADLNSFQSEGVYFCPANATVTTLNNCPTNNAFSLRVWKAAGVIQEVTDYVSNDNRKTYQRAFYGGTWSSWCRIHTTIDAPTTVSGNAGSATKLATARTINGVSFNGTANITVADATKLPLTGGTLTGSLDVNGAVTGRGGGFEIFHSTPHIDFHFGNSTADYTTRLIESASGTLTLQGNFVASGNVTAYSDRRLKRDICNIKGAMAKVQKLNGVTYRRTDIKNGKKRKHAGLIAQDVKAVLPEAIVVQSDEQKTLTVNYNGVVGLLVEAIKELDAKVSELEGLLKAFA